MKTNKEINRKLEQVFETKGSEAALELGDKIVMSVLVMREGGVREGALKETHEEWFQRLINDVRNLSS